ncbi:hypothetical protein [Acinetobacter sp. A47]|uniref:hypothetical protein n=1 Tax=Acinetobacter sp. A47 TaxID=1561217 RepID=UPI000571D2EC|nr:hypothetical protein [Acinetobacter sp. A47]
MKGALGLMFVFIVATPVFAAETIAPLTGSEAAVASTVSKEKAKNSLIKQSVKKANINEEVDTQALKLGGIHRREDAREYLELKQAEKNAAPLPDKTKVKNTAEELASK